MKRQTNSILFVMALASQLVSLAWSASPNVTIGAGQYPTTIGIKGTWYRNAGDNNVPVTISFTPPWDLTNGPKQATSTDVYIDKSQAYNASNYPDATFAVMDNGPDKVYTFLKKTSTGLYMNGQSCKSNPGINIRITPSLRFFLPLPVGKTVTQRTTVIASGGSIPLTVTSKVIAKGTVIVGAGTFNDSVMIQLKFNFGGSQPRTQIWYQWDAPYVGNVAQIVSLDNETNELFTTAHRYQWLKSLILP